MGEYLISVLSQVDWAEGVQILFLILILWVARKAGINNGQLEERLRYYIEDSIGRQDERIEKRVQRQRGTGQGQPQIQNFKSGQEVPGIPPGFPGFEE